MISRTALARENGRLRLVFLENIHHGKSPGQKKSGTCCRSCAGWLRATQMAYKSPRVDMRAEPIFTVALLRKIGTDQRAGGGVRKRLRARPSAASHNFRNTATVSIKSADREDGWEWNLYFPTAAAAGCWPGQPDPLPSWSLIGFLWSAVRTTLDHKF